MTRNTAALLLVFLLTAMHASFGQTRYAVRDGSWNSISTWSTSSGGSSGASVPTPLNDVYIGEGSRGHFITIPSGYSAACKNLFMGNSGSSKEATLTFSASSSALTVNGDLIIYGPNGNKERELFVNDGTLNVTGSLTLNMDQSGTQNNRNSRLFIGNGIVTVSGDLVFYNILWSNPLQAVVDMSNGTGRLNIGGAFTVNYDVGTFNSSTTSTVHFQSSSPQTIPTGISQIVFNHILTNNTSSTGIAIANPITTSNVTGNIEVQSGLFRNGGNAIAGNASRSFVLSDGATLQLEGTSTMVTGFGTKTFASTSTVDYSGSDQTVTAESYGNLKLSGSGTKTMPAAALSLPGSFTMDGSATATLAGDLTVNGATTMLSSSSLNLGSDDVEFNGNLTVNGSLSGGTSSLTFSGSSGQQTISGSGTISLYDLTFDNSSGVSIENDVTVSGSMTLSDGMITLDDATVHLESTATLSGTSDQRYFVTSGNGALKRNVSSSAVSFPIGTSTSYAPVSLTNSGTTDNYSVRVQSSFDNSPPGNNHVNLQWTIAEDLSGNSNLAMSMQWNASDESSGFSRSSTVYLGLWEGSYWTMTQGSVSGSDPYTLAVSGITGVGAFIVGNDVPLPVELVTFTAVTNDGTVMLRWKTESELSNAGFEIHRSLDKAVWDVTGFVYGHGSTAEPQDYEFTDEIDERALRAGRIFYRLKQIDRSGDFRYSEVLDVTIGKPVLDFYGAYPNPTRQTAMIRFSIPEAMPVTLTVTDMLGREALHVFAGQKEAGTHSVVAKMDALTPGIYLCRLIAGRTQRSILIRIVR